MIGGWRREGIRSLDPHSKRWWRGRPIRRRPIVSITEYYYIIYNVSLQNVHHFAVLLDKDTLFGSSLCKSHLLEHLHQPF
jgi:hypothetical protein